MSNGISSWCSRHGHIRRSGTVNRECANCGAAFVYMPPAVATASVVEHVDVPSTLDTSIYHAPAVATADHAPVVPAETTLGNAPDAGDTKPTNPKDVIGSRKIDLGNVPDTLVLCAATALYEGALKYGRFNWRVAGVATSIYHAACRRHLAKWWNGQDQDSTTQVHHLDNAIACLAIIRDAEMYGKLKDDRPPCPDPDAMARAIDEAEERVAYLKELFKAHSPHQFTIADTPRAEAESLP